MSIVNSAEISLEKARDCRNQVTVPLMDTIGSVMNVFKTFRNNLRGTLQIAEPYVEPLLYTSKHRRWISTAPVRNIPEMYTFNLAVFQILPGDCNNSCRTRIFAWVKEGF